ncbi:FG-GAP repeat-containing protein, partial [Arenibacter nanhaiticus]
GNDGNGSNSGHVRVYSWNGSTWVQLGTDIDGEAANDRLGWSVSLSADGSRVAIGAIGNDGNGNDSGHVRVYSWSGSTWMQLGTDIDGEAANDVSGYSVSMSANGSRVAIGALYNNGNGIASGHVRVYSWNGSTWVQLGTDIDGEAAFDQSGYSVSMSANGSRVAIGANANDGNGNASGHVRVYSWNGSTWGQLGTDIDGEAAFDLSGYSVSMDADGSRVAIGALYNKGSGRNSGHVRVYSWNGSTWVQQGTDVNGEASNDQSGYSVSMSADGSRVAIGANANDGNGKNSGHVRIYGCGQATEENEQSFVQRQTSGTIVTVFQEPQSEVLSLDMDIPYDATIKVNFLDTSGRTVLTPKSRMVNAGTNRLEYNMGVVPSQVLIMNIYTGRELIAKKILLNK